MPTGRGRPRRAAEARARDHYEVLGVSADADAAAIKRAYRRAARESHPDKVGAAAAGGGGDGGGEGGGAGGSAGGARGEPLRAARSGAGSASAAGGEGGPRNTAGGESRAEAVAAANARLAELNAAYTTLKDADRRRVYDLQREARGPEHASPFSPPGSPRHPTPNAGRLFSWPSRAAAVLFWPARAARVALTGRASPPVFGLFSEVAELSRYNLARVGLPRGSALVFVYLRESERRAAAALRRVLQVVALNVEAEPEIASAIGATRQGDDSPYPRLLLLSGGHAHPLPPPLTASNLVDAAAAALPPLPEVCSVQSVAHLEATGAGIAIASPNLPPHLFSRLRVACAADAAAHPSRHSANQNSAAQNSAAQNSAAQNSVGPLRCSVLSRWTCETAALMDGCDGVGLFRGRAISGGARSGQAVLVSCAGGKAAGGGRGKGGETSAGGGRGAAGGRGYTGGGPAHGERWDNTAGGAVGGQQGDDTAGGPAEEAAWAEAEALAAAVSAHAARGRAAAIFGPGLAPAFATAGAATASITGPLSTALSRSAAAAVTAPVGRVLLRAEAVPLALGLGAVVWFAARVFLSAVGRVAGRTGRNRVRWMVRKARRKIRRTRAGTAKTGTR